MRDNTPKASRAQDSGNGEGEKSDSHNNVWKFTNPTTHPQANPLNTPLDNPDTIIPLVDNVVLSVCFGSASEFDRFTGMVKSDTGQELKPRLTDGVSEKYCPIHRVYFRRLVNDISQRRGWLHFCPTYANLSKVQSWLVEFFGSRSSSISKLVSLKNLEIAYDIPCDSEAEACQLALVLARHMWPVYARVTYTTIVTGECKKTEDGAVNGTQTIYIQSGKLADAGLGSDDMKQNLEASGHTKLYPKDLDCQWYLRVEMTLSGKKSKALIENCYQDFTGILDIATSYPFSHFWTFKQVDVDQFRKDWRAACGFNVKRILSTNLPDDTMPVADQIRLMRAAAKVLGKQFERKVPGYISEIQFGEVVARPLPDGFRISPRLTKKEKQGDRR